MEVNRGKWKFLSQIQKLLTSLFIFLTRPKTKKPIIFIYKYKRIKWFKWKNISVFELLFVFPWTVCMDHSSTLWIRRHWESCDVIGCSRSIYHVYRCVKSRRTAFSCCWLIWILGQEVPLLSHRTGSLPWPSGLKGYWCSLYLHPFNPFYSYTFKSKPVTDPLTYFPPAVFL